MFYTAVYKAKNSANDNLIHTIYYPVSFTAPA